MDRYSKQLLYKNIGINGQKRIESSSVCIVGIGAVGSVAAELLARAGIGKLILIDRDFLEESNLQRQVLFNEADLGKQKAFLAEEKLKAINSRVKIDSCCEDIGYKNVESLIKMPDVILGCTDNMESRFLINDYSRKNNISWIYGGAVGDRGLLFNTLPGNACLRCFFKEKSSESCDISGIINSNSAIIGSLMANECLKIILSHPEKELIHMNFWTNSFEKIKISKTKKCPACHGNYEYLSGDKSSNALKLCGKGVFQINGTPLDIENLKKKLSRIDKVTSFAGILHFKGLTIFEDGRAMIKASDEKIARSLYSRFIEN